MYYTDYCNPLFFLVPISLHRLEMYLPAKGTHRNKVRPKFLRRTDNVETIKRVLKVHLFKPAYDC